MNETELHDVFQTLTRNPAPSRYDVGSVRAASRRRRRQKWSALGAAVVIGSVIAGTTWLFNPSDSVSPADSSPAGVINIEGEWKVTALNDAEGKSALSGKLADKVRVRFMSGQMTGFTGCNGVFADYKQSGSNGRDLVFPKDRFGTELALCSNEPPLFTRLLDVRHVSETEGVLSLLAADESLIATLEHVSTEPINIEGDWVLTALSRDGFPIDLQGSRGKTPVRFDQGQIEIGASECRYTASYEQGDDQANALTFSSDIGFAVDASTSCVVEKSLYVSLPEVRYVSNANGKLQLLAQNGVLNVALLERVDTAACGPSQTTLTVPQVVGMNRATAVKVLAQAGFANVKPTFVKSNVVRLGTVVAVSPAPGSKVACGAAIAISVVSQRG